MDYIGKKNISYLYARDPSILSWNRGGLKNVCLNLEEEILKDTQNTQEDIENDDKYIHVFLRIKGGVTDIQLYRIDGNNLICNVPEGSYGSRNLKSGNSMTRTYTFSKIFGPDSRQIEIFNDIVKPKILEFINGRNCTLFTYGTTGSGKTFTIVGTSQEPGIVPRALEYIFRTIPKLAEKPLVKPLPNGDVQLLGHESSILEKESKSAILSATIVDRNLHSRTYRYMQQRLSSDPVAELDDSSAVSVSIWVSFAEIYNENIYDLLKPVQKNKQRANLRLGNSKGDIYIKDLTSISVSDGLEAYHILQYGLHNLNYAATALNSHSSRSHSIFTIKLVQTSKVDGQTQISCLNFCDLAGSERSKKTLNIGDRLKESNNINRSLLVLGRCIENIRLLQQSKSSQLVPFRESKLTRMFQNALMGQENIAMIVNLNPSKQMFDESHHALEFSAITKEIVIEEKPVKTTKPKNRFSELIEQKQGTLVSTFEIEEKDDEIERLKVMVVDLYNEIEHQKSEHEKEIILEKKHTSELYKKYIKEKFEREEEMRAIEIANLKEKYESEIRSLKLYYDKLLSDPKHVINISSSSEDSFSEAPDDGLLKEIEDLHNKNCILEKKIKDLTNNIFILEHTVEELEEQNKSLLTKLQTLPQLEAEKNKLMNEGKEYKNLLHDAEKAYLELNEENHDVKLQNKNLVLENIKLKEQSQQLNLISFGACSLLSSDQDLSSEDDEQEHTDTENDDAKLQNKTLILDIQSKTEHQKQLNSNTFDGSSIKNGDDNFAEVEERQEAHSEKVWLEQKEDNVTKLGNKKIIFENSLSKEQDGLLNLTSIDAGTTENRISGELAPDELVHSDFEKMYLELKEEEEEEEVCGAKLENNTLILGNISSQEQNEQFNSFSVDTCTHKNSGSDDLAAAEVVSINLKITSAQKKKIMMIDKIKKLSSENTQRNEQNLPLNVIPLGTSSSQDSDSGLFIDEEDKDTDLG